MLFRLIGSVSDLSLHTLGKCHEGALKPCIGRASGGNTSMGDFYKYAMRWFDSLDKQEWLLVLIVAVVVGFLALQGFGSRSKY